MARYIDAEIFLKKLDEFWEERKGLGYWDIKDVAMIKTPTADVQPVVHARWEGYECSNCHFRVAPWNLGVNYCPHCGAKMDKEQDNDQKRSN